MASGAPKSNPSTDGRDGGDTAGLFTEVCGTTKGCTEHENSLQIHNRLR